VLVDHSHTAADGILRTGEVHLVSLDEDVSFIAGIVPEQDVHQGGLPCAIFAEERADLPWIEAKRNPLVRGHVEKPLGDGEHFNNRGLSCHCGTRLLKQNGHHRGTEDTEEGYFFVYREIPIDENDLFEEFQAHLFGQNIFVCRYLPTNKKLSLCPLCLCGETDFTKKKPGQKPGFLKP
jgi:hypothetical protein